MAETKRADVLSYLENANMLEISELISTSIIIDSPCGIDPRKGFTLTTQFPSTVVDFPLDILRPLPPEHLASTRTRLHRFDFLEPQKLCAIHFHFPVKC